MPQPVSAIVILHSRNPGLPKPRLAGSYQEAAPGAHGVDRIANQVVEDLTNFPFVTGHLTGVLCSSSR